MKKRFFIFLSTLFTILNIFVLSTHANVNTNVPIPPNNSVYEEGIYQIDIPNNVSYDLKFHFLSSGSTSAIIVLDENADIVYKNINCNRVCNAGTVTNKNTIVLITKDEVALYFYKAED